MNNRLRQKLAGAAAKARVQCVFAPKEYCLDNAAMVAGLAYQLHKKGA
jgi:tRNA A37 threonylcarbamoyltransferase TsaD